MLRTILKYTTKNQRHIFTHDWFDNRASSNFSEILPGLNMGPLILSNINISCPQLMMITGEEGYKDDLKCSHSIQIYLFMSCIAGSTCESIEEIGYHSPMRYCKTLPIISWLLEFYEIQTLVKIYCWFYVLYSGFIGVIIRLDNNRVQVKSILIIVPALS